MSLAQAGYDVEQLANTGRKGANPDLRIDGELADVASPRTRSAGSVLMTINDKVKKQASSVVINLADSPLAIDQITSALVVKPVDGLKKLYIMKSGEFKVIEVAK
jgi:filamentous hemagglutinin